MSKDHKKSRKQKPPYIWIQESGNVKAYVALAKLSLAHRALDLDTRRLAILEAKAAQADAAKDVLGTSLSPEEQNRRLREILK